MSFETPDRKTIFSLLRLRLPSESYLSATKNSAIVREIHTYGLTTPIGKKGKIQHKGLGKKLLLEAEKITQKEFGLKKISVISGVGAREYYRKLNYRREGEYMTKKV